MKKGAAMNKAIKNTKAFEDFKAESSNQTTKQRDMKNVKEFIDNQLKTLNNGFVATPETADQLESFARANNGSMDIVLMQMAIQYGYKIALENVVEALGVEK
jgi:hypothetical protein